MLLTRKTFVWILLVAGIATLVYWLEAREPQVAAPVEVAPATPASEEEIARKELLYDRAKEITTPDHYLNVAPFLLEEVIGKKVILVDFWTYSCINCQRTLPYLNAWHEKYGDKGLLIIGIHTPEFEFEKMLENVQSAVEEFGIKYPVVMDNDFSTWGAYKNRYWPRKYLIDIDGFIVYDHIGEGGYVETEKKIQELLSERALRLGQDMEMDEAVVEPKMTEVAVGVRTPEIYFGSQRNSYLGNGLVARNGIQTFSAPVELLADRFYLDGPWNIVEEYAENESEGARVLLPYLSKNVFMVARSADGARVRVLLDGETVDGFSGSDVQRGVVEVKGDRLYRLIEAPEVGEHELELIIEEGSVQFFTFTFG